MYDYLEDGKNEQENLQGDSLRSEWNALKRAGYLSDRRAKEIVHTQSDLLEHHLVVKIFQ